MVWVSVTARVGLTIICAKAHCLSTKILREVVIYFISYFGNVAMTSSFVGNVVVDGNSISCVDNNTALVGVMNDVLGYNRRGCGTTYVEVNGVPETIICRSNI